MDIISQQSVNEIFQDLIELYDTVEATLGFDELQIDEDGSDANLLNAFSMSLTEIIPQLEKRRLPVKGFYSDDSKTLQAAFVKEHEAYVESKKQELMKAKMEEAEAAATMKRRELIKESIAEEEKEISSSIRLSEWFTMIQNNSSPIHCRIDELTNVSARSLSKLLWNDNRIVSLDVSNLNLSDVSGSFLARALCNNNSLRKLELGGNQFGSKFVSQIAKSLLANKTSALSFLSLESNLLLTGENSKESIALFAEAVGKNTSLLSLSLWRCGLSLESGRLLAEAISKGENKLVSLEVGYNHFDSLDVEVIANKLEINRKDRAAKLAKEAELAEKERLIAEMKIQEEIANRKELENTKWLEDEAKGRAEARRRHAEEVKLEQEKEAQQLKAVEHARKMEEARVQALTKKKGGGKKGKGKKK